MSSAPAHPSAEEKLARLEERLRHEIVDDVERQELRDPILRLQTSANKLPCSRSAPNEE
jgi:hypothetical protein